MSTAITATGEKLLSSAELRELSARSNLPGIVRAVSHYGAIVVFGTLIWLVSSIYGLLWAIPLIVAQGYFIAFLFMVVHETAHKTAFRSRALNLVFGHLSSFAIALAYELLLPVSLGPSSLHAGSGAGSGIARRPHARLGHATRDRL